jgi:hypothetical protein
MQTTYDSHDIESQTLLDDVIINKPRYGKYIYKTLLFGMVGLGTFYTIYSYYNIHLQHNQINNNNYYNCSEL